MQIPLDSFEQYVPENILERGLGYFKKGKVGAIHEISTGQFKTIIKGTDLYTVKYRLNNGIMSDYSCTCPYDSSLICKHIVAVMFHLQQDRLQPGQIQVKKTKKEPKPEKSAPLDNHMNYPDIEVTDESCREQIKNIIRRVTGRERFIEWDKSPNYCIKAFKKEYFKGWDWHTEILHVAVKLIRDTADGEKVITLLEQTKPGIYEKEAFAMLHYKVMAKIYNEKQASGFLEKNLHYDSFRSLAIEQAIAKKDYERASALAYAGLNRAASKNNAGTWHKYLLKIAQELNDASKIIENARYLFLNEWEDNLQYYDIIKAHVKKNEWHAFLEKLIKDFGKPSHINLHSLAHVFISEQYWDRLLKLVAENSSFTYIKQYEKFLQQDYSKELAGLYEKEITEYLLTNISRGHYKEACRYIRRIIKLGHADVAGALIKRLKNIYPQRRALVEELDLV